MTGQIPADYYSRPGPAGLPGHAVLLPQGVLLQLLPSSMRLLGHGLSWSWAMTIPLQSGPATIAQQGQGPSNAANGIVLQRKYHLQRTGLSQVAIVKACIQSSRATLLSRFRHRQLFHQACSAVSASLMPEI
jgi:hypothetical protein